MQRIIIVNWIDWSESFVDANGSFYCGATAEQKQNAARLAEAADLIIYAADLHPLEADEFAVNGGLYPVHNTLYPERLKPDFVYMRTAQSEKLPLRNKTTSPRLTDLLAQAVKGRKSGLLVPRDIYFQASETRPFCAPGDIEETFRQPLVSEMAFLKENFQFMIAPKKYFDATRLGNTGPLPPDQNDLPLWNVNVFNLLVRKYPTEKFELWLINTGVVESICLLHTSIGLKQLFPRARVINVADATTPLYGLGLGFASAVESRTACERICREVGIEYLSTAECLRVMQ
ncbi:MAG: hypothetical protein EHM45_19440 [Desulfobacteraceae bacterium]|nr:MAG: hypothetical protein EHM45_19440 [Desulfobacteraceae bacterium]